jgi:hypothetical protein
MQFVASVIDSIAWPLVVGVALYLLRKPISGLLPLLRELSYKEFKINFAAETEQIRDLAMALPVVDSNPSRPRLAFESTLETSPRDAVIEAWAALESSILDAANRLGWKGTGRVTTGEIRNAMTFISKNAESMVPGPDLVEMFDGFRRVRNEAAHLPKFAVSRETVERYLQSARLMINWLEFVGQNS